MQRSYEKLVVWKEADDLCVFTYQVTQKLPSSERFGLVTQMRRSSASVPTNIVEGNSRSTVKDRRSFLIIALASLDELHYQYHLCLRLEYIDRQTFNAANDRIQRVGYLLSRFKEALHTIE